MHTLDRPPVPTEGTDSGSASMAVLDAREARSAPPTPREVLSFRLGAEEYGIDILRVQEIRSFETCTHIANAPAFIKGVVNLRGVIVPIVDLRLKFGLHDAVHHDNAVTIVLNVANRVLGIVVDSVSDVLQLSAEQIQSAPEFNDAVQAGHIIGVATVMNGDVQRMLILVDIEHLMTSADMGLVRAALH